MLAMIDWAGPLTAANDHAPKQGITGKVIKMKGNFMPTIVEPGAPAPANQSLTALSVPVHVFKGRVAIFEKPDPKHPALVKTVQSGKDGSYRLALEPGEYTVVAEIHGKLYLNSFTNGDDGKMYWSTITVKANEWARQDVNDSSEAAF